MSTQDNRNGNDEMIGRGVAFPLRMSEGYNHLATVGGDDNIKQSIYIIIHTAPGERVMRPDFGCAIHDLIFSPANNQTAREAERHVSNALKQWEPRIDLQEVRVSAQQGDLPEHGYLLIEVDYTLKSTSDSNNLIFPFYLNPQVDEETSNE